MSYVFKLRVPTKHSCWYFFSSLRRPRRDDVTAFQDLLNHRPGSVVTDPHVLHRYNVDWTRKFAGNSHVLLKPCNTSQVSDILKYCHEHNIGVVPQGGNTGLVGGSVSTQLEEIIISTEAMNQIESFDPTSGVLQCQSGCILQVLQDYTVTRDHLMPIDLGSKGSCTIGGNVSTNAGTFCFILVTRHSNNMTPQSPFTNIFLKLL